MLFNARQLRYFIAIAEHGSLAHAATALHVAQSALSYHLAALEKGLAVPLLDRHARGVRLTPAGQRLLEHARAIVAATELAERDVRDLSSSPSGSVAVGLAHTAVQVAGLPLMRAVRRELPAVVLGVSEALSAPLIERVLRGALDMAVVFNAPEDSRLESEVLLEEDMYLVGVPSLLGDDMPVAFDEITRFPLLFPHSSVAARALIENSLLRNRVLPAHVMEIDSLTALNAALAEGLGCSVLARSTISAVEPGRLLARRIVAPELRRGLSLVHLAERPRTSAFTEVQRLVTATVRSLVANGAWDARLVAP
jgi:LysR family nitrogen assimilation transcriptional regulator